MQAYFKYALSVSWRYLVLIFAFQGLNVAVRIALYGQQLFANNSTDYLGMAIFLVCPAIANEWATYAARKKANSSTRYKPDIGAIVSVSWRYIVVVVVGGIVIAIAFNALKMQALVGALAVSIFVIISVPVAAVWAGMSRAQASPVTAKS